MAQGEYIAPEKIENVYAKCKFIAQCFIYGEEMEFYCWILSLFLSLSLSLSFGLLTDYLLLLVGDSLNSSLVAVVSVDPDVLKAWAASEGIKVLI